MSFSESTNIAIALRGKKKLVVPSSYDFFCNVYLAKLFFAQYELPFFCQSFLDDISSFSVTFCSGAANFTGYGCHKFEQINVPELRPTHRLYLGKLLLQFSNYVSHTGCNCHVKGSYKSLCLKMAEREDSLILDTILHKLCSPSWAHNGSSSSPR